MDINDENLMTITDEEGNEYLATILFTYHHDDRNKDYVVFYLNDNPDDVLAMAYSEEGELIDIDDEEELAEVNEVYASFLGDDEEEN